jgi:CHASE2 domain-containing sensor protein
VNDLGPLGVFVASFAVSAFAGVAALLREQTPLRAVLVVSASLNSGMLGLGVSLLWYAQFRENVYSLVGICVILGLTGNRALEWVFGVVKKLMAPGEADK